MLLQVLRYGFDERWKPVKSGSLILTPLPGSSTRQTSTEVGSLFGHVRKICVPPPA
jgi:hypothetical protein